MLLQKAFFRKKNVRIYIVILTVLFSVVLLLNGYKKYYEKLSKDFMSNHLVLVIKANKDNKDLIENEDKLKSYQRILSFDEEKDNSIILNPPITKGKGVEKGEHSSKLYWDSLEFNGKVLVFHASFIDKILEDNETILVTNDYNTKSEFINDYLNETINFNYHDEKISFKVKEVVEPISIPYICISDNLYNDLLTNEEDYIYYGELKEYSYLEDIQKEWEKEIKNNEIMVESLSYFKDEELNMNDNYQNIINILKIANIISMIIFYIIIVITIKNLVIDEHKDIILLRQMGYNNKQNIFNILKNLILLDLITTLLDLIIYILIIFIFNLVLGWKLDSFDYQFMLLTIILIIVIEIVFSIREVKKK